MAKHINSLPSKREMCDMLIDLTKTMERLLYENKRGIRTRDRDFIVVKNARIMVDKITDRERERQINEKPFPKIFVRNR